MTLFSKIFGDTSSKFIKGTIITVEKINSLEKDVLGLKNEDFPKKTQEFKERIAKGETLDAILPEAFAAVKQACKRMV